jgi:hypothetical protein
MSRLISVADASWRRALAALPRPGAEYRRRLAVAFVGPDDFAAKCGTAWMWWPDGHEPSVEHRDYAGGSSPDWGLLLVISEAALDSLGTEGESCIALLVRRGEIRPFLLQPMEILEAAGLGDLIETLGLAFPRH